MSVSTLVASIVIGLFGAIAAAYLLGLVWLVCDIIRSARRDRRFKRAVDRINAGSEAGRMWRGER